MLALPGYASVGFLSVVLLVVMRFLTGIFLGGQYTGAVPLAMESAPKAKRGLYGGLISMGFPIAFCVVSAITYAVQSATSNDLGAYVEWGWRIPVAVGGVVTVAFAWYYQRSVEESPAFSKTKAAGGASPLKQLFRGENAKSLRQVFVLMTGIWILSNATSASFPQTFRGLDGMASERATMIIVFYQVALIVLYPLCGMLSQRIGRRRFLALCGLVAFTVAPVTYLAIVHQVTTSTGGYTGLAIVLVATSICAFGATGSYISERFPSVIRSTGYGVAYSVAVVIPAFYAFYEGWLSALMPSAHTNVVMYVVGGVLLLVGALWGPETKDVDLGAVTTDLKEVAR
jgi:MFS family permease